MSTLLPSASARPLLRSGIASGMPPVPVLVPTPAPSCLNHVSMVNVAVPRPGAGPKVTYSFVPSKSSAVPAAVAVGVGVAVAVVVGVGEGEPAQLRPKSPPNLVMSVMSTNPSGGSGAMSYRSGAVGTGRPKTPPTIEISVISTNWSLLIFGGQASTPQAMNGCVLT